MGLNVPEMLNGVSLLFFSAYLRLRFIVATLVAACFLPEYALTDFLFEEPFFDFLSRLGIPLLEKKLGHIENSHRAPKKHETKQDAL